jgi:two-component system sensor histidine kinase MprB
MLSVLATVAVAAFVALAVVALARRDVPEPVLAGSALVAWALVIAAGGGPVGPALATFALGVIAGSAVVAVARAMALRRARRATERAQATFVGDASHALRTPLAALRLRLDDLEERLEGSPLAPTARAAGAEALRLEELTGDLLTLTADGAPSVEVALDVLARDVAAATAGPAAERGVAIEVLAEAPAVVRGARLDRALGALAENAVRYTEPGTTVTIAVAGHRVEVRDEGPGLASGEEERVFARFARGSAAARAPQGAGLGLAIARQVAEAAGGSVTLANRPEGGAVAVLELPA